MNRTEIEKQICEKKAELASLEEELKNCPGPLSEQTWLWGSDDGCYRVSLDGKVIATGLTWGMAQMLILLPVMARKFKVFDKDPTCIQVKDLRSTLDKMDIYFARG